MCVSLCLAHESRAQSFCSRGCSSFCFLFFVCFVCFVCFFSLPPVFLLVSFFQAELLAPRSEPATELPVVAPVDTTSASAYVKDGTHISPRTLNKAPRVPRRSRLSITTPMVKVFESAGRRTKLTSEGLCLFEGWTARHSYSELCMLCSVESSDLLLLLLLLLLCFLHACLRAPFGFLAAASPSPRSMSPMEDDDDEKSSAS